MVGAGELTMLTWQRWGFYVSFKNFQFDGFILGPLSDSSNLSPLMTQLSFELWACGCYKLYKISNLSNLYFLLTNK